MIMWIIWHNADNRLQRRIKARAFDFVVNLKSDIQTTSIVAQITPSNVQITLEVSYAGNKQLKTTANQIQKEKGGGEYHKTVNI